MAVSRIRADTAASVRKGHRFFTQGVQEKSHNFLSMGRRWSDPLSTSLEKRLATTFKVRRSDAVQYRRVYINRRAHGEHRAAGQQPEYSINTFRIGLHARSCVHSVSKQAVPGHFCTHDPCSTGTYNEVETMLFQTLVF